MPYEPSILREYLVSVEVFNDFNLWVKLKMINKQVVFRVTFKFESTCMYKISNLIFSNQFNKMFTILFLTMLKKIFQINLVKECFNLKKIRVKINFKGLLVKNKNKKNEAL